MDINWFIVSAVVIGAVVLILFLIRQNTKDEKKIKKELNYFKKLEEEELNDDKDL